MKKLAIFDLDGTLIDSLPDIAYNVNATLTHFGLDALSTKKIKTLIGGGAKNLIFDAFGGNLTDTELAEKLEYYNNAYSKSTSPLTKLFSGVKEMLFELKNRGYIIAVLSNKPNRTVQPIKNGLLKGLPIDIVQGACEEYPLKPNPQGAINMCKSLNVNPENAYMIGDGETDVTTAINSGMKGVAVLWGYRTKNQLQNAGATTFALNPQDILKVLN